MMFGPHTAKLLRAAMSTGVDARASRDAGSYLCNYLSWRAIEAVNTGRRSAPCRVRPCAAARARRRFAAQGRDAPHHAGRAGRCRRSHAAGDGEADAAGGTEPSSRIGEPLKRVPQRLTLPPTIARFRLPRRHCPAAFLRYSTHCGRAARASPETANMDVNRRLLIGHPPLARRAHGDVARWGERGDPPLRARARRHPIWCPAG